MTPFAITHLLHKHNGQKFGEYQSPSSLPDIVSTCFDSTTDLGSPPELGEGSEPGQP